MSETRADSNDPYDRMIAEAKRLARETLLAGLNEDLEIAQVNFELNALRALLQEEPTISAS